MRARRWKGDTGSYLKPVALLKRGHGNQGDRRWLTSTARHAVTGTAARTHALHVQGGARNYVVSRLGH